MSLHQLFIFFIPFYDKLMHALPSYVFYGSKVLRQRDVFSLFNNSVVPFVT